MRTAQMDQLLAAVARLTSTQRSQLLQLLQAQPTQAQVVAMVESRLRQVLQCPERHAFGEVALEVQVAAAGRRPV